MALGEREAAFANALERLRTVQTANEREYVLAELLRAFCTETLAVQRLSEELVAARADLVAARSERIRAELQLKTLQGSVSQALRVSLVPPPQTSAPEPTQPGRPASHLTLVERGF